ncbi:hypothetical protein F5876DRAFT_81326 [Lentinula aff. lateritia]|uniref:Uncharacterized protein n=1 Tax=Lentinula aff. lateritia TaxID=2804960 RepID=A0ACC1TMX7_9AGAR|nr:hypothetical protein F5876DRAFT_81326 [Lentinula aff. lateritia]
MVTRLHTRTQSTSSDQYIRSNAMNSPAVPIQSIYDLGATRLLQSLSDPEAPREPLPPLSSFPEDHRQPSSISIDWNMLEDLQPEFSGSREEEGMQALNNFMLNIFEHGPDNINSDDEFDERLNESNESDVENGSFDNTSVRDDDAFNPYDGLLNKRPRSDFSSKSPEWFPWPNRTTCTLDILMHLPRSVFSVRQLELFLWLLRVNGVQDATSVKSMKDLDAKLQSLYGIQTYEYKGAFGHTYYVNSLADIISQEMCNPHVRPHLEFYPEDCNGKNVSEARQSSRMLNEIPDEELGPMVRLGPYDFYIFEPAKLRSGVICMPHRWFKRDDQFFARCWKMQEVEHERGSKSWRVIKGEGKFEVHEDQFILPFPALATDMGLYPHLTDVTKIEDFIDMTLDDPQVKPWTLTNPNLGNPWRQRANGAECLSFPIWLYCDDTSGNTSKRWNEHNSFLFTPAGLPRAKSSQEYNVHFLVTSNTAPPLEMMDGIADQILDCQENGIWAWDPMKNTRVLLLVCVLALLGDNPMQSEFASHIGMRGKFFCRICWVKGKDASADDDRVLAESVAGNDGSGSEDDNGSETRSVQSASTTASRNAETKKKRAKFKESLKTLVKRVKDFVLPGTPRNKAESIEKLKTQFVLAQTPSATNKVKSHRTDNGLKDTFQTFFIDRLLSAAKRRPGNNDPTAAVNQLMESFPSETMSPVWRIRGLDPHADTPVEILHVVLLGFVKYLWRDVIENQIKKNPAKKKELAARLSSFDIEGLGLDSKLAGDTLVDYAGSLTGSDFRKICQVAPFVLKDFVSDECYQTWISLSKLIPLIWQPEIEDLDTYLPILKEEIQQFLLHAAKWSIRWFNKPKFHILVHLPEHIRRFGPAILFATEVFESYNAVIRAKSVHSNRLAPSRDIARAFAKQNRLRHMLSGGTFLNREHLAADVAANKRFENTALPQRERVTKTQLYFRCGHFDKEHWITVGPSPLDVVAHSNIVSQYLGIEKTSKSNVPGTCTLDSTKTSQRWNMLQTSRAVPDTSIFTEHQKLNGTFRCTKDLILANGDRCSTGSYVACTDPSLREFSRDGIAIIQVREMLRLDRKDNPMVVADSVLVEAIKVGTVASCQGMPRLSPSSQYFAIDPSHDCIQHKCPVKQVAPEFQERQKSQKLKGVVVHRGNPQDQLLNTAQMRDAKYIQRFRIQAEPLSFNLVLEQSATHEWNAMNKSKPVTRPSARRETPQMESIPQASVQSNHPQREIPPQHLHSSPMIPSNLYPVPTIYSSPGQQANAHHIFPSGYNWQDRSHGHGPHSPRPNLFNSFPPVHHPSPTSYLINQPPLAFPSHLPSNRSLYIPQSEDFHQQASAQGPPPVPFASSMSPSSSASGASASPASHNPQSARGSRLRYQFHPDMEPHQ